MNTEIIRHVREMCPLVHCITNYVTVNDVANMLLACGGSPIMADDIGEAADITSICNATVINIGTLNVRTIESMIAAGKRANELGHPVILDPVGAGASALRTETTFRLLKEVKFSVIRGNISEIKTVYAGSGSTKGVDADAADTVTEDNIGEAAAFAKELSARTGAVIAITGAIDVIADKDQAYITRNGESAMSKITGTGCMLSAVIAAYYAANPDCPVEAVTAAIAAEGLCGEIAAKKAEEEGRGTSSLRTWLIDAMSNMDDETLAAGKKVERV